MSSDVRRVPAHVRRRRYWPLNDITPWPKPGGDARSFGWTAKRAEHSAWWVGAPYLTHSLMRNPARAASTESPRGVSVASLGASPPSPNSYGLGLRPPMTDELRTIGTRSPIAGARVSGPSGGISARPQTSESRTIRGWQ